MDEQKMQAEGKPESGKRVPMGYMRTYVGAKIIQATPMTEWRFIETERGVDPNCDDRPAINRDGYLVEYPDGYRSWSTADVFEGAYRLVSDGEGHFFVPDREDPKRIKAIARVCHEVNRAYCQALGDNTQVAWEDAPEWQRNSAIAGVLLHMNCPDAGPEESHVSWMRIKEEEGWKFGPVKDAEKKEHPCIVPFDELPREQQAKDFVFRAVVHALKNGLDVYHPPYPPVLPVGLR